MSYMHIKNLRGDDDIFLFRECYAMEKIHGTSAHIRFKVDGDKDIDGGKVDVGFFSGGASHEEFVKLFNETALRAAYCSIVPFPPLKDVTIYGEAYGGKMQGMSTVYGKSLRFVAFEVKIGDRWLSVPDAESVVKQFNLDFVSYVRIPTDYSALDAERDKPSVQAVRNGMGEHPREGIVVRPLMELTKNNGERIIGKHKTTAYSERKTPRKLDAERAILLAEAKAIVEEWVTPMRLLHVLDALLAEGVEARIENMRKVLDAMKDDVIREAGDEIVVSPDAIKEINRRTAVIFKEHLGYLSLKELR